MEQDGAIEDYGGETEEKYEGYFVEALTPLVRREGKGDTETPRIPDSRLTIPETWPQPASVIMRPEAVYSPEDSATPEGGEDEDEQQLETH